MCTDEAAFEARTQMPHVLASGPLVAPLILPQDCIKADALAPNPSR
ncbi:hypothetical protein [Metapseudomonas otitidis]|nr:hypothetical protein [Pseudomonas otitidis]